MGNQCTSSRAVDEDVFPKTKSPASRRPLALGRSARGSAASDPGGDDAPQDKVTSRKRGRRGRKEKAGLRSSEPSLYSGLPEGEDGEPPLQAADVVNLRTRSVPTLLSPEQEDTGVRGEGGRDSGSRVVDAEGSDGGVVNVKRRKKRLSKRKSSSQASMVSGEAAFNSVSTDSMDWAVPYTDSPHSDTLSTQHNIDNEPQTPDITHTNADNTVSPTVTSSNSPNTTGDALDVNQNPSDEQPKRLSVEASQSELTLTGNIPLTVLSDQERVVMTEGPTLLRTKGSLNGNPIVTDTTLFEQNDNDIMTSVTGIIGDSVGKTIGDTAVTVKNSPLYDTPRTLLQNPTHVLVDYNGNPSPHYENVNFGSLKTQDKEMLSNSEVKNMLYDDTVEKDFVTRVPLDKTDKLNANSRSVIQQQQEGDGEGDIPRTFYEDGIMSSAMEYLPDMLSKVLENLPEPDSKDLDRSQDILCRNPTQRSDVPSENLEQVEYMPSRRIEQLQEVSKVRVHDVSFEPESDESFHSAHSSLSQEDLARKALLLEELSENTQIHIQRAAMDEIPDELPVNTSLEQVIIKRASGEQLVTAPESLTQLTPTSGSQETFASKTRDTVTLRVNEPLQFQGEPQGSSVTVNETLSPSHIESTISQNATIVENASHRFPMPSNDGENESGAGNTQPILGPSVVGDELKKNTLNDNSAVSFGHGIGFTETHHGEYISLSHNELQEISPSIPYIFDKYSDARLSSAMCEPFTQPGSNGTGEELKSGPYKTPTEASVVSVKHSATSDPIMYTVAHDNNGTPVSTEGQEVTKPVSELDIRDKINDSSDQTLLHYGNTVNRDEIAQTSLNISPPIQSSEDQSEAVVVQSQENDTAIKTSKVKHKFKLTGKKGKKMKTGDIQQTPSDVREGVTTEESLQNQAKGKKKSRRLFGSRKSDDLASGKEKVKDISTISAEIESEKFIKEEEKAMFSIEQVPTPQQRTSSIASSADDLTSETTSVHSSVSQSDISTHGQIVSKKKKRWLPWKQSKKRKESKQSQEAAVKSTENVSNLTEAASKSTDNVDNATEQQVVYNESLSLDLTKTIAQPPNELVNLERFNEADNRVPDSIGTTYVVSDGYGVDELINVTDKYYTPYTETVAGSEQKNTSGLLQRSNDRPDNGQLGYKQPSVSAHHNGHIQISSDEYDVVQPDVKQSAHNTDIQMSRGGKDYDQTNAPLSGEVAVVEAMVMENPHSPDTILSAPVKDKAYYDASLSSSSDILMLSCGEDTDVMILPCEGQTDVIMVSNKDQTDVTLFENEPQSDVLMVVNFDQPEEVNLKNVDQSDVVMLSLEDQNNIQYVAYESLGNASSINGRDIEQHMDNQTHHHITENVEVIIQPLTCAGEVEKAEPTYNANASIRPLPSTIQLEKPEVADNVNASIRPLPSTGQLEKPAYVDNVNAHIVPLPSTEQLENPAYVGSVNARNVPLPSTEQLEKPAYVDKVNASKRPLPSTEQLEKPAYVDKVNASIRPLPSIEQLENSAYVDSVNASIPSAGQVEKSAFAANVHTSRNKLTSSGGMEKTEVSSSVKHSTYGDPCDHSTSSEVSSADFVLRDDHRQVVTDINVSGVETETSRTVDGALYPAETASHLYVHDSSRQDQSGKVTIKTALASAQMDPEAKSYSVNISNRISTPDTTTLESRGVTSSHSDTNHESSRSLSMQKTNEHTTVPYEYGSIITSTNTLISSGSNEACARYASEYGKPLYAAEPFEKHSSIILERHTVIGRAEHMDQHAIEEDSLAENIGVGKAIELTYSQMHKHSDVETPTNAKTQTKSENGYEAKEKVHLQDVHVITNTAKFIPSESDHFQPQMAKTSNVTSSSVVRPHNEIRKDSPGSQLKDKDEQKSHSVLFGGEQLSRSQQVHLISDNVHTENSFQRAVLHYSDHIDVIEHSPRSVQFATTLDSVGHEQVYVIPSTGDDHLQSNSGRAHRVLLETSEEIEEALHLESVETSRFSVVGSTVSSKVHPGSDLVKSYAYSSSPLVYGADTISVELEDNALRDKMVKNKQGLLELDTSFENILELPDSLIELNEIQSLRLDKNWIRCLPENIDGLNALEYMSCRDSYLLSLPDNITKCKWLKYLDLDNNMITTLPWSLSQLKELRCLSIQANRICPWPRMINGLTQLEGLDLSGNTALISISRGNLSRLINLQWLYLERCSLIDIPPDINKCTELSYLSLASNRIKVVPSNMSQLSKLHTLNLSDNRLNGFPEPICGMKNLQELSISKNTLKCIPENISCLTKLRKLDLENIGMENLPLSITKLLSLESLDVANNKLSSLPQDIVLLCQMRRLDLHSNKFAILPEWLFSLADLEFLDVSNNCIKAIPKEIDRLTKLRDLNISSNHIMEISGHFQDLQIEYLDVSNNELDSIPQQVAALQALRRFSASHNKITDIPSYIVSLSFLENLDLSANKIETINPPMSKLVSLKYLDLSNNRLLQLGKGFSQGCPQLIELNLQQNQLRHFPPSITRCTSLQTLNMDNNKIASIPTDIERLENLKVLTLSHNRLITLPDEICSLDQLFTLNIRENHVRELPLQLDRLRHIDPNEFKWVAGSSGLVMDDENMVRPPTEVLRSGRDAVFRYFKELRFSKAVATNRRKIVLLGQTGAGKSSFANALLTGASHLTAPEERTRVMEQHLWSPADDVKCQINDFGGHDVYTVTHHFFLTRDAIYLVMLDVSIYTEAEHYRLVQYWIDLLTAHVPNAVIRLVATHSDLCTRDHIEDVCRVILMNVRKNNEKMKTYLQSQISLIDLSLGGTGSSLHHMYIGMPESVLNKRKDHFQSLLSIMPQLPGRVDVVSSAEGLEGIDLFVENLMIQSRDHKLFRERVLPSTWLAFEEAILHQRRNKQIYLTWKDLEKIADEDDNLDIQQIPGMVTFLTEVGEVLWYKDEQQLRKILFHRPSKLAEIMKGIFKHDIKDYLESQSERFAEVLGRSHSAHTLLSSMEKGLFPTECFRLFWEGVDDSTFQVFFNLMQAFHLCYVQEKQVRSGKLHSTVCFPCYLPEEPPPEVTQIWARPPDRELHLEARLYFFPHLPTSFIEEATVRLQSISETVHSWRNGIYATSGFCKILLQKKTEKMVSWAVRGEEVHLAWSMFLIVSRCMETHMACWPGAVYEIYNVCAHCVAVGHAKPHLFPGEILTYRPGEDDHQGDLVCPMTGAGEEVDPLMLTPPENVVQQVDAMMATKVSYHRRKSIVLGVSFDSLDNLDDNNDLLNPDVLQYLASQLGPEWKSVALLLDFTPSNVKRFEYENPFDRESQVFSMLREWRDTWWPRSDDVSVLRHHLDALDKALIMVGRIDLADFSEGLDPDDVSYLAGEDSEEDEDDFVF